MLCENGIQNLNAFISDTLVIGSDGSEDRVEGLTLADKVVACNDDVFGKIIPEPCQLGGAGQSHYIVGAYYRIRQTARVVNDPVGGFRRQHVAPVAVVDVILVEGETVFPENPLNRLKSADTLGVVDVSGNESGSLDVVDRYEVLGDLSHSRDVVDIDADAAFNFYSDTDNGNTGADRGFDYLDTCLNAVQCIGIDDGTVVILELRECIDIELAAVVVFLCVVGGVAHKDEEIVVGKSLRLLYTLERGVQGFHTVTINKYRNLFSHKTISLICRLHQNYYH